MFTCLGGAVVVWLSGAEVMMDVYALERVVVSPHDRLLPEARRVVSELQEFASSFLGHAIVVLVERDAVVLLVCGALCARWDVERRRRVLKLSVE